MTTMTKTPKKYLSPVSGKKVIVLRDQKSEPLPPNTPKYATPKPALYRSALPYAHIASVRQPRAKVNPDNSPN